MADGKIEFSVELDAADAERELAGIKKKILKAEAELSTRGARKTALEEKMARAGVAADQANEKLQKLIAERERLQSLSPADGAEYLSAGTRLPALNAEIKEQQATVKGLEKAFNDAAAAVETCDGEIQKTNDELKTQQALFTELSREAAALPEHVSKSGTAAEEAGKRMEKFKNRVAGLVKGAFVFSVIYSGLRALRGYLTDTTKANAETAAQVGQLKAAFQTMVQPLLNLVIPALNTLLGVLTKVVSAIAAVISAFSDTTVSASAEAAEALNAEEAALKGVGGAAKDAGRQLASFDEIETLSDASGSGGGAAATESLGSLFDAIKNFQLPAWLEELGTKFAFNVDDVLFNWKNLTGEGIAKKAIAGLTAIAGGVAGFAIGGVPGAVVGTLGGFLLGILIDSLTFDNDGKLGKEEILKMVVLAITALAGGALGFALTHTAKGAAIGFLLFATVGLLINTLTFDGDGNISSTEIVRLVRTALLAIAGGVLGFVLTKSAKGALIGMSIGVILSLLILGLEFAHEKEIDARAANTELGKLINAALEQGAAELETAAALKVNVESITGEIAPETLADLEFAKTLIDEIFEIDAEDNKTAGQLALLKDKIAELNGLGLEGLQITFDETTGHVDQTREAMQGVIDTLLEQYRMEAMHDAYVEQFKNQYLAEADVKRITEELVDATDSLTAAEEEASAAAEEYNGLLPKFQAAAEDYWQFGTEPMRQKYLELKAAIDAARERQEIANENLKDAKAAVDDLSSALETSLGSYEKARRGVKDLETAYEELLVSLAEDTGAAKDGGKNIMEGTAAGIRDGYQTAEDAITAAHKALQDAADAVDGIHSPSTVYAEHGKYMMEGLARGILDNAYLPEDAMRAVCNSLISLAETGINNIVGKFNSVALRLNQSAAETGITIPALQSVSIPRLATGAVIPPNRSFLAVLGDQKSGTNIETPLDTMVQAFRQALAEQGGGAVTLVVNLDGRVVAQNTVKHINDMTRSAGKSPLLD